MEWCAVNPYEDESKTEGKEKNLPTFCNDLSSSVRCRKFGRFFLFVAGGSVSTRAHRLRLSPDGRAPLPEEQ
jgi:hypothetical protein